MLLEMGYLNSCLNVINSDIFMSDDEFHLEIWPVLFFISQTLSKEASLLSGNSMGTNQKAYRRHTDGEQALFHEAPRNHGKSLSHFPILEWSHK